LGVYSGPTLIHERKDSGLADEEVRLWNKPSVGRSAAGMSLDSSTHPHHQCELPGQEPGLGQRVGSQTEATPRVHLMVAPTYTARFPADPGISAALKEEFGPQAQHPQKEG
jgi:hypothetical protein